MTLSGFAAPARPALRLHSSSSNLCRLLALNGPKHSLTAGQELYVKRTWRGETVKHKHWITF
jgi:hypothetical protein